MYGIQMQDQPCDIWNVPLGSIAQKEKCLKVLMATGSTLPGNFLIKCSLHE